MSQLLSTMTVDERRAFAEAKNAEFIGQSPEKALEYFLNAFPSSSALSSSLSYEDQAITDMMVKIRKDARIFTLLLSGGHILTMSAATSKTMEACCLSAAHP